MLKRLLGAAPSNPPPPPPQSQPPPPPSLPVQQPPAYDMFYIPVARPRQQIHGNAEGHHQQQITMPSPEVLQILPPPAVVEDPPPPGSRPWWLVHCLYLSLAILMAFLGDRYGFSPTSYFAPPPPQPQTQESGPPDEGMLFNPFISVPPMDMHDHLRMEKDLKLFVYPDENGFKIPREDKDIAYLVNNLYQSPYLTSDAHEAQLFFIPISLQKKQKSNESIDMIEQILNNPYWSRFGGADHFFINCGNSMMTASKSKVLSILGKKAIQLVCSSNHDSEFVPFKDILLPSTRHNIPREALTTQICRCDYGSPSTSCVADAIHSTCIPVVNSNLHQLPFSDIVDWSKFAIIIRDNNTQVLKSLSNEKIKYMIQNLHLVQIHFKWHAVPVRADAFHMVLYGLWRRRGGL